MYGCESGAIVSGNLVYFNPHNSTEIYAYDHVLTTNCWSRLPDCPHRCCSLAVINGLVTTIGGGYPPTNTIFSLFSISGSSGRLVWTNTIFPPMPTERNSTVSLCTGTSLIVAGGSGSGGLLRTVEILNSETCQWTRVADLPQPLCSASATLCDNHIYIVERYYRSVYTCSVSNLLESWDSSSSQLKSTLQSSTEVTVWKRINHAPLYDTTCVSFHDKLLVVGGLQSVLPDRTSTAIHMYDSATDSWNIISNMLTARSSCFAAVLPDNQLMVVGGIAYSQYVQGHVSIDSVEFAIFT